MCLTIYYIANVVIFFDLYIMIFKFNKILIFEYYNIKIN